MRLGSKRPAKVYISTCLSLDVSYTSTSQLQSLFAPSSFDSVYHSYGLPVFSTTLLLLLKSQQSASFNMQASSLLSFAFATLALKFCIAQSPPNFAPATSNSLSVVYGNTEIEPAGITVPAAGTYHALSAHHGPHCSRSCPPY
jgi:hypothetical protein